MSRIHDNKKIAFVFPGIGVELTDREPALYIKYKSMYTPFFEEGSALANADLADALLSGTIAQLGERESQLFIYCFSCGTFQVYAQKKLLPDLVAGYSFGIYTALYAAKVISFSEGLAVLDRAYSLMAGLEQTNETGINAIIGLALPDLENLLEETGLQTLYRINSNNEYCHIFCGNKAELALFNRQALKADAINAVTLDVSLPYHHPVLSYTVKEPFTQFITSYIWQTPGCPMLSTLDQNLLTTPEELMQFTADHLHTPINWYKTVKRIYAEKCTHIIECGPGISLTQNARFVSGNAQWINCKNSESRLGI